MSSITPSDRARQTDELRSQREEYQNRETEEVKRHKKEMKRLAEKQSQEIDQLKSDYEQKIKNLKDRSGEQLTERDQENQAKIDKLRGMYMESLRKRTDESENMKNSERDTLRNQLVKEKQIHEQQRNLLKQNFDDTLTEKDRNFEDYAERSKDEMHQALQSRTELLSKKHDQEIKSVTEDRDEKAERDARALHETRSALEGRLKDQKKQDDLRLDRVETNWQNVVQEKNKETSEMIRGRDEALKLEREKMQHHFQKTMEGKEAQMDRTREDLKDTVISRIDRDVKAAESENRRLQNDHLVEMMTTKRLRDLEKDHLVMNYEDRMEKLEKSKDGLIERTKEVNRDRIAEVSRRNDGILQEATRRFKGDQIVEKERHEEDRDRLEIEHKREIASMGGRTEKRVNQIIKATGEAQKSEHKQHAENLAGLKDSYQTELSRQREAQMEQLKDTYLRMDERIKTTQDKLTKKLEETAANYEEKISQLQEQHQKELQRQADSYEQRMASQKKALDMEQKSQEMKTDLKFGQLQQQHEKEIDRLEKRHQEQMAALAQKLSYYRKNS